MLRVCCFLFCTLATAWPRPGQVHLALGPTHNSVAVAWANGPVRGAEVRWGTSKRDLSKRAGSDARPFTMDSFRKWYTHTALMTGLRDDTVYYYRVGGRGRFSKIFSYHHRRARAAGEPYRHVIFGDLGTIFAFSVCKACNVNPICVPSTCAFNSSVGLVAEAQKSDMMLHMGDFAYDFDTLDGFMGDQFMRNIEQLATKVPYMVSHGNHEDGDKTLAHFVERFRHMPSNADPPIFGTANGNTTNVMYFSWDHGLVHYVSISTELWFGVSDGTVTKDTMLQWLRKDLTAANTNRDVAPWIVVQGHRSVYCTDDGDCAGPAKRVRDDIEPILFEFGVDFFLNGHEHNYERTFPLYQGKSDRSNIDPKATIYIVSGAAGNTELHEPFTEKQPSWSAFRSNSFGYSVMEVYNATHVHWQQIETDPTAFKWSEYGRVIDDTWVVQSRHGPFDTTMAPKGQAFPVDDPDAVSRDRSYDHWWPLLDIDDGSAQPTDQVIREWRAQQGECSWIRKLNGLMGWTTEQLGANERLDWEDVRDESAKNSDGAIFRWRSGGLHADCPLDELV